MKRLLQIPQVLLLIETSRIYGRQLIEGIGRYAREHGPWSFTLEEHGLDELSERRPNRWNVDGVISRLQDPRAARRLQTSGLPFVELLGNPITGQPDVAVDEEALARIAAGHLLDLGLQHMGFFACRNDAWLHRRRQAFVTRLASLGHSCAVFEAPAPSSRHRLARSAEQRNLARWLTSLPKPAGVLCATDLDALVLLDLCREIGIAVPDRLAVLGVDNDSVICSAAWPPLSSIDVDAQRIGYQAAARLALVMGGEPSPTQPLWVLPRQVVARESTDVLAIADAEVVQAVRFIRLFACEGIHVSHVVDHIAVSRRMLERRFRACLGRSLQEELLRVKIDKARLLLSQGDYPIKRIGSLCGFNSLHSFARAFRRETGISPGHHRHAGDLPPPD